MCIRDSLLDLVSGQLVRSIAVDGVPTGACRIPRRLFPWQGAGSQDCLAIVVQGEHESGAAIPGVRDPRHRLHLVPLHIDADAPEQPLLATWHAPGISYPNGACIVSSSTDPHALSSEAVHYVSYANWNGNSVACVPLAAVWPAADQALSLIHI